jgi:two-component system, OmpR family, sensor histidine kinase ArlS
MKIKTKLTLKFSLIVTTILLLFSSAIYFFSAEYRSGEFKKKLTNRAITVARLMTIVSDTNNVLFDQINRNTVNMLYDENLFIYDYNSFALLYSSYNDPSADKYNISFLHEIKQNATSTYSENGRETIGVVYPDDEPKYIAVASAVDQYGNNVLINLKFILIGGLLIGLLITIVMAFFFANDALKPISGIIKQVDNITASRLYSRVSVGKSKDEISTLARTFNNMLDRLENAFAMQKSFVSNSSHELRTPLTSMKGQIEVTLMNKRSEEEYIAVLNSLMADTENMTTLINGFLEMAESNMEGKLLKVQQIRIDELLFSVKDEIVMRHKGYTINICFDDSKIDDYRLILFGNPHLLRVLFLNIIDNACKFSINNTANIIIKYANNWLDIGIHDKGIGIPESEISRITEPYYRASNVGNISGHGIGMSIAKKIIDLHRGEFKISTVINERTNINVLLPFKSEG